MKILPMVSKILLTIAYIICPALWILAFLGIGLYGKYFKNAVTSFFNRYILPPAFVILIFFFVFKENDIYPFGNKTIAWCDMAQQGVPYWMNFKSVLSGEDSIFLNMANAAGMNGWSLLRGLLFSPFNYIALFIERGSMMEAVSVLQVLKFAACSVTAMIFFKLCFKKLHPSMAAVLSLMYSFCAYGLMYCQIISWPDAMYLCPLFFAGVYLLITKGNLFLYSISLAFVMNNFSFGFMTVIATILFVGYYTVVCKDTDRRKEVSFNFVVGSLLAALLSATSWLPFFGVYGSSARGVDIFETIESKAFFSKRYTVYPLLMSTALIPVAAFAFNKINKKPIQKAMYFSFGMLLIPMVVEPINLIWHGGSYTGFPARFAYILIFLGLAIAASLFSQEDEPDVINGNDRPLNNLIVQFCSAVFLVSLIVLLGNYVEKYVDHNIEKLDNYAKTLWGNEDSFLYIGLLFVLFLAAYALCYGFYKLKLINKQLLALTFAVVLVFESTAAIKVHIVPSTTKVNTENFSAYANLSGRIDDDGFYRVKNEEFLNAAYSISEANYPGAIGYSSIGHYSSLTSETYLYLAKALGYSSVWMKIDSYGGTKFSDALMSVKYGIEEASNDGDVIYKNEKCQIVEKEFFLPLGLFSTAMGADVDLENIRRIDLQEMIFDSLTDTEKSLFREEQPSKIVNCYYTHADNSKDGKYSLKKINSSNSAYLEYTIEVEGTKTLYFDCFDKYSQSLSEATYNSFSISVNGGNAYKYPKNTNNGLQDLGTYTDTTVTVKVTLLKNISCRSFGIYSLDDDLLTEAIDDIGKAYLTVDGNTVSGEYNSESDGYLLVSIPWDSGFKATVNGEKVDVSKAFGGLISIPVAKGNNVISISYTPPKFYASLVLTLLGVAICICILILLKKKKVSRFYALVNDKFGYKASASSLYDLVSDKFGCTVSKIASVLYICVLCAFVAVVAIVYFLPLIVKLKTYLPD